MEPSTNNQGESSSQDATPTATPTPTPTSVPASTPALTPTPKYHGRNFYLIAGLIGVAAIVAIFVFVTMIINNKQSEKTEPEVKQQAAAPAVVEEKKTMTAAEKEAAVKETLSALKLAASVDGQTVSFQDVYDTYFPYYKPESAKTGTTLEKSFSIVGSEVSQPIADAMVTELEALGFVEYDDIPLMAGPQYINEENGVICSSVAVSQPFVVTCAHTSWITTAKLAFIDALAKAYKEKEGKYPSALNASKDDIIDSVFEPYQRITASLPDAGAIFYRPNETADWVFFTSGQSAPTCAEFAKDTGARRAFQGQTCASENGELLTINAS